MVSTDCEEQRSDCKKPVIFPNECKHSKMHIKWKGNNTATSLSSRHVGNVNKCVMFHTFQEKDARVHSSSSLSLWAWTMRTERRHIFHITRISTHTGTQRLRNWDAISATWQTEHDTYVRMNYILDAAALYKWILHTDMNARYVRCTQERTKPDDALCISASTKTQRHAKRHSERERKKDWQIWTRQKTQDAAKCKWVRMLSECVSVCEHFVYNTSVCFCRTTHTASIHDLHSCCAVNKLEYYISSSHHCSEWISL